MGLDGQGMGNFEESAESEGVSVACPQCGAETSARVFDDIGIWEAVCLECGASWEIGNWLSRP